MHMTNTKISVIIPSLPARKDMLGRALGSVYAQTFKAYETCVSVDTRGYGAAFTRQRALELAQGEWVAFLDDDDEFLPEHLFELWSGAIEANADYTFSYFVRSRGGDPLGHFGKPFNPEVPHHTTMTVLCKRELALNAGFLPHDDMHQDWSGEDWRFTLRCIKLGAKIVHIPKETWLWHRHSGNSSGLAGKGDAR